MSYTIYKIANENKYQVVNRKTGEIHAYNTTYKNAIKQIRLMGMMDSKKNKHKKKQNLLYFKSAYWTYETVIYIIYFIAITHKI